MQCSFIELLQYESIVMKSKNPINKAILEIQKTKYNKDYYISPNLFSVTTT